MKLAAIFTLCALFVMPEQVFAQFIETDCPTIHPNNPHAWLDSAAPLEDGKIANYLPEINYREKDGTEISVIDYRYLQDLNYRQAKLRCRYHKAPDVLVDIPGLLTRCVRHTREVDKKTLIYLRGYCESDISPPPAANGQ